MGSNLDPNLIFQLQSMWGSLAYTLAFKCSQYEEMSGDLCGQAIPPKRKKMHPGNKAHRQSTNSHNVCAVAPSWWNPSSTPSSAPSSKLSRILGTCQVDVTATLQLPVLHPKDTFTVLNFLKTKSYIKRQFFFTDFW